LLQRDDRIVIPLLAAAACNVARFPLIFCRLLNYWRRVQNGGVITVIGLAAAFLTTAAFIPQVVRTWKSRSASDFSWAWVSMFSGGISIWLAYGVLRSDVAVIVANAATLLLVSSIAYVKLREK
jgi:MtN3 and saliva related transmembrane protein